MEKKKNDVRLNKSLRDVYIKDARRFLESQTNNPKYQAFLESRENCRTKIDDAFKTATAVVERRFNPTDVADLRRLQNKYTTVDSVGKDSCFYMAVVDSKGKPVNTTDEYNDAYEYVVEYSSAHADLVIYDLKTGERFEEPP